MANNGKTICWTYNNCSIQTSNLLHDIAKRINIAGHRGRFHFAPETVMFGQLDMQGRSAKSFI
ncbi:hypothetical protein M514_10865 [Trichuris suis]|uniref:Uncharacterized protein n=1 Tax=Trichuris suis TaxID=68888 RepID=A0A085N1A9_9BILA|nr:hypothetical protein M513_10865 [Trichuris suis]KFD63255.1 hypothetical protein M514_10865 [Trichuris suis]